MGSELSLSDIAAAFADDVAKATGKVIDWKFQTANSDASDATNKHETRFPSSVGEHHHIDSLEQKADQVFQAKKLGYEPGTFIIDRTSESPAIYKLQKFVAEVAVIAKIDAGVVVAERNLTVMELLNSWRIHKGQVQELMCDWAAASPIHNKSFKWELAKAKIIDVAATVYQEYEGYHSVVDLLWKPAAVRASVDIDVGGLVLAPCSSRIDRKQAQGGVFVGKFDLGDSDPTSVFLNPQFTHPIDKDGRPHPSAFVVPFFHVQSTKGGPFNMDLKIVEDDATKVRIPVLVNSKPMTSGTELRYSKAHLTNLATSRTYFEKPKKRVAPQTAPGGKKLKM